MNNNLSETERLLALLLQDCAGRRLDEVFPIFATQARAILTTPLIAKRVKELLND